MDGEQEAGLPKENPEKLFQETLKTSRQTMESLVVFAIENGVPAEKLSHVKRVFEPNIHILLPPIETMRRELANITGESDRSMRTRALLARNTGEVFVPEELAGSVHDVLHESIHRAAWLGDRKRGLNTKTTNIAIAIASRYGITISQEGRVDPKSEYIQRFAEMDEERNNLIQFFTNTLKEKTQQVTEGLAEWTVQKAGVVSEEDAIYGDEAKYIEEVRSRLKEKEELSDSIADAKLVTAALTGDISELVPYL